MAISLLASQCPSPQGPTGFKKLADAYAAVPPLLSARTLTAGDPTSIPSKWNSNAQFLELLARYGPCGVFAVAFGLTVSLVSGLTIQVAAGHAVMTSIIELPVATNLVVLDNAQTFVWFKQDGTLEGIVGATPPAIDAVHVATVTAAAGVVSATIDYSGVMRIAGQSVIRETADDNLPTDIPPSSLTFYTRTKGGLFFWDGTRYLKQMDGFGAQLDNIPATHATYVASGEQVLLFDSLSVSGTMRVAGKLRVME